MDIILVLMAIGKVLGTLAVAALVASILFVAVILFFDIRARLSVAAQRHAHVLAFEQSRAELRREGQA